jgi:hypothetical protein
MNIRKVRWAMQHDWYISHEESIGNPNQYAVIVRADEGTGEVTQEVFEDIEELSNWAGY